MVLQQLMKLGGTKYTTEMLIEKIHPIQKIEKGDEMGRGYFIYKYLPSSRWC